MNDASPDLAPRLPDTRRDGLVKLAIMAVGGQGGGVLTNWIEDLARAQGYACQATSVAGVAQRTGATIYYVEMVPDTGRAPIFSLAPAAGDVDILIAAEMMEAGRAIMRGLVTPDRTVLIASTHRALAVSEKTVPGDGIANADEVRAAAEIAARRLILGDMERLATEHRSVRLTWPDGTIVSAWFTDKGDRSSVAIQHDKLGSAARRDSEKLAWGERLAALAELLARPSS